MRTFALGNVLNPGNVSYWCEPLGDLPDGGRTFRANNGLWEGVFHPSDGTVHVVASGQTYYGNAIIWEGEVPEECSGDYNRAIQWIDDHIRGLA
jgi:hypothetical protein